jgi:hypothetical protein
MAYMHYYKYILLIIYTIKGIFKTRILINDRAKGSQVKIYFSKSVILLDYL